MWMLSSLGLHTAISDAQISSDTSLPPEHCSHLEHVLPVPPCQPFFFLKNFLLSFPQSNLKYHIIEIKQTSFPVSTKPSLLLEEYTLGKHILS